MPSGNTIYFNVKDAVQYYDPLAGISNGAYYVFAARSQPWPDDLVVPQVDKNAYMTNYQIFDEMLFGKQIKPEDVSLMIDRNDWVYGTVYDKYDDTDPHLFNKKFFVVTFEASGYHVFKCLNNNDGGQSTVSPKFSETDVDDNQYYTSDGYQWKYMYTVDSTTYQKFTTNQYIPVVPNANVTAAATNGSIDTILIDIKGQNYYSYTNGHFDAVYVDGNVTNFALSGSGNILINIANANGSYQVSEFVTQSNPVASGYVKFSNSTALELRNVNGQFAPNTVVTGFVTGATAVTQQITDLSVSSNNNFYTGSSIYIKNGAGAGQVKQITNYVVSGSQRIITIDSPFAQDVDLTSKYEIAPTVTIQGDGSDAIAVSTVNTSTYGIQSVTIINSGRNYSYANVYITGNTGTMIQANTASAKAIIAPPGGHGFDVLKELGANKVGVAITFANTDPLPKIGSYRRVGILKEPHYNKVVLNTTDRVGSPNIGELVIQQKTISANVEEFTDLIYKFSYIYSLNAYSTVTFSTNHGLSNGNFVQQISPPANAVVVNKISNTSAIIRTDTGLLSNGATIKLASNTLVNAVISNIGTGFGNTFYGLDNANSTFTFTTDDDYVQVFVNNTAITSSEFASNSDPQYTISANNILFENIAFSNNDVVNVDMYRANAEIVSVLQNQEFTVQGTVTASNSSSITLTNVTGLFDPLLPINWGNTGAASISNISGQNSVFDQRTILSATYQPGSANLSINDQVFQFDTSNNIVAFGYIHSTEGLSNTITVNLTNVKGEIQASTNSVNKYIQTVSSDKVLKVESVTTPPLIPYSGDVIYFENGSPITRSNTQSETIRLGLSFYQ